MPQVILDPQAPMAFDAPAMRLIEVLRGRVSIDYLGLSRRLER